MSPHLATRKRFSPAVLPAAANAQLDFHCGDIPHHRSFSVSPSTATKE
jgi:hypothetical protein